MSYEVCGSLYDTAWRATLAVVDTWLYAGGLGCDADVLVTLRTVPHETLAAEVEDWAAGAAFELDRAAILEALADIETRLTNEQEMQS